MSEKFSSGTKNYKQTKQASVICHVGIALVLSTDKYFLLSQGVIITKQTHSCVTFAYKLHVDYSSSEPLDTMHF